MIEKEIVLRRIYNKFVRNNIYTFQNFYDIILLNQEELGGDIMKKRTPRETLKSFSWIYVVISLFYVVGIIICNVMPELKDGIIEGLGKDGMLSLNITAGVTIVLNLWYFWLCRRAAEGKSAGTLYMILLIIGVIGSIITFVTTKGVGRALSFDAIVDLCGLYFLMQVRKEGK